MELHKIIFFQFVATLCFSFYSIFLVLFIENVCDFGAVEVIPWMSLDKSVDFNSRLSTARRWLFIRLPVDGGFVMKKNLLSYVIEITCPTFPKKIKYKNRRVER